MKAGALRCVVAAALVVLFCTVRASGQTPRKNYPLKPTLVRLETNMATNRVSVFFIPAQFDKDYVNAEGTIIYRRSGVVNGQEQWEEIARVPGAGTNTVMEYSDPTSDISRGAQAYRLASYSSSSNSSMTDSHETIFLSFSYDTCQDQVTLKWNPYKGWGTKFDKYLVCEETRGTMVSEANYVTSMNNQADFRPEFTKKVPRDAKFYMAVQVQRTLAPGEVLADGKTKYTSWSNVISFETRRLITPKLQIDSVIGRRGSNSIRYSIDSASRVKRFELIARRDTTDGASNWTVLDAFEDKNHGATVDVSEGVNSNTRYYMLRAIDECDQEVSRSRDLNSIVLRLTAKEDYNYITFNELVVPSGSQAEYRLHRVIERNGEAIDSELKVFVGKGVPLEYKDRTDLPEFRGLNFLAKYEYYVVVREVPSGRSGIARGRSAIDSCFVEPKIVLPTAIAPRPMDGGATSEGRRMEFKPLSSGTTPYEITIYNRAGQVIFHKENEPWTGRLPNGQYAPEGAYIYNVKLKAVGYKIVEKTGSLMVVYPYK